MVYFTSDLHFGHTSVLSLCGRPFATVEEMDRELLARYNRRVRGNDTVYILGDLVCKSHKDPLSYVRAMKGKKILITGNHDGWILAGGFGSAFAAVLPLAELRLEGRGVVLCHYPMLEWPGSRKEGTGKLTTLIFGHIHRRTDALYTPLFSLGHALHAGVDINDYQPVTLEELEKNNERFKLSALTDPVQRAAYLSRSYHRTQSDKAGKPYYLHPAAVAALVSTPEEKIVAYLHDALEDTALSPALIEAQFGPRILQAVQRMTHGAQEDYFAYVRRIKEDPIARAVKLADLRHNSDLSRLRSVGEHELARVEKYKKAIQILTE